jgi:hypothetical protein
MIKTEPELWTAIADTLEMIEDMPPFNQAITCPGLCCVLTCIWGDELIPYALYQKAKKRVWAEFYKRKPPYPDPLEDDSYYIFPKRVWKPRVGLARPFAEESPKR